MTSTQDATSQSAAAAESHGDAGTARLESTSQDLDDSSANDQSDFIRPSQRESMPPAGQSYAGLVTSGNARVHAGNSYNSKSDRIKPLRHVSIQ